MRFDRYMPRIVLFVMLMLPLGCVERRVVKDGWDSWKPNHRPGESGVAASKGDKKKGKTSDKDIADVGRWTISLGTVTGPEHASRAANIVRDLVDSLGLAGVWAAEEEAATVINHGRYESPNHPRAQDDLFKLRQLQNRGTLKTSVVMLVPATQERRGSLADYDLLNVPQKGHYTLLLGYYDEEYGDDYRNAAEQAAAALRQEGYQAYYYHAPNMSQVTIGVFPPSVVQQVKSGKQISFEIADEKVLALQHIFPNYLGNGREQIARTTDARGASYEGPVKTQLGTVP